MKKSEALMVVFLLRADEFYLLTRFSNRAFLQYMTYRMAHHALEYYLKAGLSVFLPVEGMKKLGHDVVSLWKEYKRHVPAIEVDARVISHINNFESMRYPDTSKIRGTLWGASYKEFFKRFTKTPEKVRDMVACFSLEDFDKIIWTLRNSLPQGNLLPFITVTEDAETYLYYENKYFLKREKRDRGA